MLDFKTLSRLPAHYQTLESVRIEHLLKGWCSQSPQPLTILDYGFGTGKYLPLFSSLGMQVSGADINPDYIEKARSQGYQAYHESELPQLKESFDVIFLSHLIEHLTPDHLVQLLEKLIGMLKKDGRLIIVCPLLGERFFHDFSHIRPYYPQSIRHAFGQSTSPLSYGATQQLVLKDIYFFKDPFRTRLWRSFYIQQSSQHAATKLLNTSFDFVWRLSKGHIGVTSSWLGVYTRPD